MNSPNDILKKYWGFDSFRYPQYEIIQSTIGGNDTIALLATGAGKSICFQVAGLALGGLCVVISPLIALMDDQVERLKSMDILAEAIHSGRSMKDVDRILNNAYYGKLQFLYLSPERLQNEMVLERLSSLNIKVVAIDEAHCVSQWGFDFRPFYLRIGEVRERIQDAVFIALTATASSQVLDDIKEHLALKLPTTFKTSFLRGNISMNVIQSVEKRKECYRLVKVLKGSGILYVRSRYQAENIAEELGKNGVSAMFYHAGLRNDQRKRIQKKWQEGKYRVVVATNAFGMGIDKADVRFVLHYDVPDKPEEYYQEAGRAGRDGLPATAIVLYNAEDISKMDKFFKEKFPTKEEIKMLFHRICVFLQVAVGSGKEEEFEFDLDNFAHKYGYNHRFVKHALKTIESSGWLEYFQSTMKSSSMMIKVQNRELRAIIRNKPQVENIVNSILRMYESIFFEEVPINEEKIAKLSKMPRKEVERILLAMDKREWISYHKNTIDGKLFFIEERPSDLHFSINERHYNYLKKITKDRIIAMKAYVKSEVCRQQILLKYFGEVLKKPCGICDVCRGVYLTEFSAEDRKKSIDFLKKILVEKPVPIKSVVSYWPYNKRKRIIQLISVLENEKFINIHKGIAYWVG